MEVSVGGIVSNTFGVVKERFGVLIGTWFVYFAIQMVFSIVLLAGLGASVGLAAGNLENPAAFGSFGIGMILMVIIFYLAYFLIYCAQNASLNALASPLQQIGFGDAFGVGLRSALPLLGVMVILAIGYLIGGSVLGLVFGLLSFMGRIGSVIGGLAMVVIILYLASRLAIIFPTIAVEGVRNPLTAIARSWNLTRGKALPIFLATLIYGGIVVVLCGIALLPVIGTFTAMTTSVELGGAAPAAAIGSMVYIFFAFVTIFVLISISAAAFQSVIHAQVSGSTGENFSETFA